MLKTRVLRQVLVMAVAAVTLLAGSAAPSFATGSGPPAEAGVETRAECWVYVEVMPGKFEYVNICEDPGGGDDDDGGGGVEWEGPSCDLSHDPYNEFCLGEKACRADIPSTVPEENWPEQRPSDTAIFTFVECLVPGEDEPEGRYRFIDPYQDALPDLGWAAYGKLQTPAFTLSFDPAGMTYVGVDTTFSIDGVGDGEIIGGVAGPLHATGTLTHVEIDPGDSSGVIECDPDLRAEDCVHVYLKTSHDQATRDLDKRPSYPAQARLIYDVTFTVNGEQVSLPGVPDVLESPWNGTLVPVGEIQVLVE